MLRYLTAGESHGKCLCAVIEGLPSGLKLSAADVDHMLALRQSGHGRGGRMAIEKDRVEFLSGVRHGRTLGSPLSLLVPNRDWVNWERVMSASPVKGSFDAVTRPRPGHADLTGCLKYDTRDCRDILERSSARETAARVAVGAIAKRLLNEFGMDVYGLVMGIGGIECKFSGKKSIQSLSKAARASSIRCPDKGAAARMIKRIDAAKKAGDSLGGTFTVVVTGVPPGLGSHVQWDRKLDARLAYALMSIQAIKGVELGLGFGVSSAPGSRVHDEIFYSSRSNKANGPYWPSQRRFYRITNNAGGTEGGMSNGEDIVVRAAMKPIPTLYKPKRSVDIVTKKPFKAAIERSDVCAVPAASVVGEAVVAIEVASLFMEKFGSDSVTELKRNYLSYLKHLKAF